MTDVNPANSPFPGLAGCLLGVMVALGSPGCILPQDQNVFPDLPPPKNTPPKIQEENFVPPSRIATVYLHNRAGPCANVSPPFSVTVVDNDLVVETDGAVFYSDAISHRWVIDEIGQGGQIYPADIIQDNTKATRTVVAPSEVMTALGALAGGANRHLVQVYVTDGQFGSQVTYTKYSYQDAAYVDSFNWYVEVIDPCQQ